MGQFVFSILDYFVFLFMLTLSTSIGIYFGFFAKMAKTTDEYLMGGRKLKVLPIAISLVASQLSAFTIMTLPGEIYAYGVNYFFFCFSMIFNIPFMCLIILPVFYNNNISNCYEYLELRFNTATRQMLTFGFIVTFIMFTPIFNFMPSLAFSQVTDFNIHVINAIVTSICIFYTMFGGIKAVVWTDVVQGTFMLFSILFVCIMGVLKVGGITNVYQIAQQGHRLELDFTFDLKTRTTIWNASANSICIWISYVGLNQNCVQRIASLPTVKEARRALIIFGFGFITFTGILCFIGFIFYALYHGCDPIKAGFIDKPDKMLAYYVQDIVGHLNGIPGLFISCLFSASLSTLSAGMNALSGIIYMDYIRPHIKHNEIRANRIMKLIVLLLGVYSILGGFIVEKFTSILQLMFTINGLSFGTIFGVYTMGMLIPKVHGRAAFLSVILSMITVLIIIIGAKDNKPYKFLPSSIENCSQVVLENTTISALPLDVDVKSVDNSFNIFDMSFNWYTSVGALVVFVLGLFLSFLLPAAKNEKVDPKLLSPIIYPFIKYQLAQTEEQTNLNGL